MSLKLWFPLNGDFHNQGLDGPLNFTTTGTITDQPGKIGQSKEFSSSNVIAPYNFTLGTEISACCWIYYTAFPSSSSNDWILDLASSSGYANTPFGLSTYHSTKLVPIVGGKYDDTYTHNFSLNTWYHIAFTWNSTEGKLYINGELKKTYTTLNGGTVKTGNKFSLGSNVANSSTKFKGRLNDVHIYDHCLSAKEVEEISKGLILHYKLDNDNNAGYGWLYPNGEKTITRTSSNTFIDYAYYPDLITSSDTSYTVDFYAKGSVNAMKIDIYFRDSSGAAYAVTSQQTLTTNWEHYSLSLSGSPETLVLFRVRCYKGTANDIVYIKNIKLLSNNMPIRNNIIYDSSGYNNNGVILNGLSLIDSSPRYNNAAHFSATDQKIKISNLSTIGFTNSYSFAWWEKISSVNPMHWGFADGIRLNGMYTGKLWNTADSTQNPLYNPGTTTQVTVPTVNVWHHWVMTGNGTKCLVYQDGELWAEAKTYKSITGTTIYINGWDTGTNYSSDNASMADFRIYSTALTAEQVKELYNTSTTIDKNGNIYAREQIESLGDINMTKTGQLQSNKIVDNNTITIANFKKSDKSINGNTIYEY